MINKDGGKTIFRFCEGDTAVMRGDIELMGVPPVPPLGKTLMSDSDNELNIFLVSTTGAPSVNLVPGLRTLLTM